MINPICFLGIDPKVVVFGSERPSQGNVKVQHFIGAAYGNCLFTVVNIHFNESFFVHTVYITMNNVGQSCVMLGNPV